MIVIYHFMEKQYFIRYSYDSDAYIILGIDISSISYQ